MNEIIAWLRSPEGEAWSRNRMTAARYLAYGTAHDVPPTEYQTGGEIVMPGMFTVKEDH